MNKINFNFRSAIALVLTGMALAGLAGCAAAVRTDAAGQLAAVRRQFAGGQYRQSLEGCRGIIDRAPGCAGLDQALYYAALNSLQLQPGDDGRAEAAGYLRRLISGCPLSALRPEAEAWLPVIAGASAGAGHGADKDREIERLRSEIKRLNREIDLLKDVDIDMHRRQKGP